MYPYYDYRNVPRNIPANSNYFFGGTQYPPQYPYSSNHYLPSSTYPYYVPFRKLPPVDTKLFIKSAQCIQNHMISANTIVDMFASTPQFSVDIMTAAQYSDKKKVEQLIHSLGLNDEPIISYTPDGLSIQFGTKEGDFDVCHLTLKIRWG
jgi:hypothetical protein